MIAASICSRVVASVRPVNIACRCSILVRSPARYGANRTLDLRVDASRRSFGRCDNSRRNSPSLRSAKKRSFAQTSDEPAAAIVPTCSQRRPTPSARVSSRSFGRGRSVHSASTSVEPLTFSSCPGAALASSIAAEPSMQPVSTGVPCFRLNRRAASVVTWPAVSLDARTCGSSDGRTPIASHISSLQPRSVIVSYSPVNDALDGSVTRAPVSSRCRNESRWPMRSARRISARSCRRNH